MTQSHWYKLLDEKPPLNKSIIFGWQGARQWEITRPKALMEPFEFGYNVYTHWAYAPEWLTDGPWTETVN